MSPQIMLMGREVRRVPMDYQHPTIGEIEKRWGAWGRPNPNPKAPAPLFLKPYDEALREWWAEREEWIANGGLLHDGVSFEQWTGTGPPDPRLYLSEPLPPEDANHPYGIQLWETISEGSPLSPVFPDSDQGRQQLAEYMAASDTTSILSHVDVHGWRTIIDGQALGTDVNSGELVRT